MDMTDNIAIAQARAAWAAGKKAECQAISERLLGSTQDPATRAAAWQLLGVVAYDAKDWQRARDGFEQARLCTPHDSHVLNNLSMSWQALGDLVQACQWLEQAVALRPQWPEGLLRCAKLCFQTRQWAGALRHVHALLADQPRHLEAGQLLVQTLCQAGQMEQALKAGEHLLKLHPTHQRLWLLQALLYQQVDRMPEALKAYEQAAALGEFDESACLNQGLVLRHLRRWDEAERCYRKALAIRPDFAEAYNNLGVLLKETRRYEEAIGVLREALRLRPDLAQAHHNLGFSYWRCKDHGRSLEHFRRAMALAPDGIEFLLGDLLLNQMMVCDWRDLPQQHQRLRAGLQAGQSVCTPGTVVSLVDEPDLHLQAARTYAQLKLPKPEVAVTAFAPPGPKIRIGYYSADLHNHATAYLMASLFELHDRDRFELHAFSFGPERQDEMRQRLRQAFDHFHEVSDLSDEALAALSRDLGIDIAVDLKGYTQDGRPGLMAYRCAPVQAQYIGFPGSMGAPWVDYAIGDAVVLPAGVEPDWSEQLVRLPGSYQVNDPQRRIAPREFTRAELGLPEQGFVFACFNNNYKITPDRFAVWMRLLSRCEGSVLWLLADNPLARHHLRAHAQAAGVDPNRLVFAGHMPLPEHLARQRCADLFLDTAPYNAHTTASDALWAGLPVLTCPGRSFASRVAASLLHAVGLPELIAPDMAHYEAMAQHFWAQPDDLLVLRQRLREQTPQAPLFDAQAFARHLERAYETMHARRCAGLPPAAIDLSASA
jgi:protein O-GlcNAc transferase